MIIKPFDCYPPEAIVISRVPSCGKSTLINALLRTKLMPSKNGACTANIVRICDDAKKYGFCGTLYNADGVDIGKCGQLTYDRMKEINDNIAVSQVNIRGNIPFIDSTNTSLILIDTPEPDNARNEDHRKVTAKALDSSSKMLVLYVMNGIKLHDDEQDEFLRRIAKSLIVGGRRSRERFIFVINKMDCYDDDDDIAGEIIPRAINYLEEMGISNPNIFPVSAEMALVAYLCMNEIEAERKPELYADFMASAKRIMINEQLHLEKYPDLPCRCRCKIENELNKAKQCNNVVKQCLIHSGIRGIEERIKIYVNDYYEYQGRILSEIDNKNQN